MKTKALTIRISEEHLNTIKALAEKENCSVSDFVISRALGEPLKQVPKTKVYLSKVYEPKKKKVLPT